MEDWINTIDKSFYFHGGTEQDVSRVVKSLKRTKSPGLDGINSTLVKHIESRILSYILM